MQLNTNKQVLSCLQSFLDSLETYQATPTHTTLGAYKCSLELSNALMDWLAPSDFFLFYLFWNPAATSKYCS